MKTLQGFFIFFDSSQNPSTVSPNIHYIMRVFNLVAFSSLFTSNRQSRNACAKELPTYSDMCCEPKDPRSIRMLAFSTSVVRRNTEGENVADENHRGAEFAHDRQLDVGTVEPLESFIRRNIVDGNLDTPAILIVAGLASEYYEREKEAESKAAEGNIGNGSASNPVMELPNVSSCPNEDIVDEGAQTEALDVVRGNELVVYNGVGTLSENEADIGNGCPKVRHVQPLKNLNGKRKFKGKKPKIAEPDVARGTFINCSSDTDEYGRTISDPETTDSMPCQGQSSRGRLLKPTPKLLQLANSTGAPAGEGTSRSERKQPKMQHLLKPTPKLLKLANSTGGPAGEGTSGAGEGTSGSEQKQPKRHRLSAIIARETSIPRIPAETNGNQHNHHQSGVANPNGSGIGVEVGQAGGVNAAGRQTDMVVPMLEPMVCVTNRNPMDFSIEEAKKYMRTE